MVGIINDFSGVAVQRGTLQLTKTVVAVPDVDVPATFTAHVACDDGTQADVTLPGSGGPGTPDVSVKALSLCFVEELAGSIPAGWAVTYSVDGGPATTTPPIVGPIAGNTTITVAITNDPTNATTTTTTVASTTTVPENTTSTAGANVGGEELEPGSGTGSSSGDLPFTGLSAAGAVGVGVASLAAGLLLLGEARRRRVNQPE